MPMIRFGVVNAEAMAMDGRPPVRSGLPTLLISVDVNGQLSNETCGYRFAAVFPPFALGDSSAVFSVGWARRPNSR
ncbi:hypothetical protein [Piscinibacter terrae]|uniref:Uncharacterized protein n=1 Tax=Piscinibacter terrae TaxID=2496871 RepID=A0A3N7JQN4_9BURK|nr:hypothetical protein [Albitalea terrae]RQP23339.1 hypothetical protein DZC73_19790 [Albitalea terrae]